MFSGFFIVFVKLTGIFFLSSCIFFSILFIFLASTCFRIFATFLAFYSAFMEEFEDELELTISILSSDFWRGTLLADSNMLWILKLIVDLIFA